MLVKMMWRLGSIAFLIGIAAIANGQTEPSVATTTSDIDDDTRVRQILKTKASFDFDETPFNEIMDEIQARYQFNVFLDQSAIDDSLTEDDLITFKIRDIPLDSALRLMLLKNNATYIVDDGVLRFISKDEMGNPEYFTRKIINCRELLQGISNAEKNNMNQISAIYSIGDAPMATQGRGGGAGGFGGGGFGGGVFQILPKNQIQGLVEKNQSGEKESADDSLFLVQRGLSAESRLELAIKSSIAPEDWDDTSGSGTVQFIGGCLIIQQNDRVIEQVEKFLSELAGKMNSGQ